MNKNPKVGDRVWYVDPYCFIAVVAYVTKVDGDSIWIDEPTRTPLHRRDLQEAEFEWDWDWGDVYKASILLQEHIENAKGTLWEQKELIDLQQYRERITKETGENFTYTDESLTRPWEDEGVYWFNASHLKECGKCWGRGAGEWDWCGTYHTCPRCNDTGKTF
jgi:hypothetical protein